MSRTDEITVDVYFEGEHFQYWYYACDYRVASINAFGPVYLEKPKPGAKKYDGTEPECQICLELGEKLYNGMCEAVDTNEVTAKINISREVYNRLREANEKSPIWFKGELTPDNYAKAYLVFPPLGYGGL